MKTTAKVGDIEIFRYFTPGEFSKFNKEDILVKRIIPYENMAIY